jgi:hypothetical protein
VYEATGRIRLNYIMRDPAEHWRFRHVKFCN